MFGNIFYGKEGRGRRMKTTNKTAMLLLINAIAVLSEDRFLVKSKTANVTQELLADSCDIVGWSTKTDAAAFGPGGPDPTSVKGRLINLISAVRTLMRSMWLSIV